VRAALGAGFVAGLPPWGGMSSMEWKSLGHRNRRPSVCHRRPDSDQGDRRQRRGRLRGALEILPL